MTLSAKAKKLRTQFGMERATVNAVVTAAIEELGLDAHAQGLNLVQQAGACVAALGTRQATPIQVDGMPTDAIARGGTVEHLSSQADRERSSSVSSSEDDSRV